MLDTLAGRILNITNTSKKLRPNDTVLKMTSAIQCSLAVSLNLNPDLLVKFLALLSSGAHQEEGADCGQGRLGANQDTLSPTPFLGQNRQAL